MKVEYFLSIVQITVDKFNCWLIGNLIKLVLAGTSWGKRKQRKRMFEPFMSVPKGKKILYLVNDC